MAASIFQHLLHNFDVIIISSFLQFIVQTKFVLLKSLSSWVGSWRLLTWGLHPACLAPSLSGKIIRYSQEQDVQFPAAELRITAAALVWSDTRGPGLRWSNKQNCSWSSAITITLHWDVRNIDNWNLNWKIYVLYETRGTLLGVPYQRLKLGNKRLFSSAD